MSIQGISGAGAAGRITPTVTPVAPAAPGEAVARDPRESPLVQIDEKTRQPVPLRFPWLSRLSAELERAAGKPAPFGSAPDLGDQVDTKV